MSRLLDYARYGFLENVCEDPKALVFAPHHVQRMLTAMLEASAKAGTPSGLGAK